MRLLICIRKTKGVGRAVYPSFRVTKDQGSQSKVFSLDFFLLERARSKVCARVSNYRDVSANFSRWNDITGGTTFFDVRGAANLWMKIGASGIFT